MVKHLLWLQNEVQGENDPSLQQNQSGFLVQITPLINWWYPLLIRIPLSVHTVFIYLFMYFLSFFYRSCLLLSFLGLATTKDTSFSVSLTQWIYVRYVFYVSLDLYSWSSLMNERVLSFGKPTWVWVAYEWERYSWSCSGMPLIITFL
jgi:hypothetical protein